MQRITQIKKLYPEDLALHKAVKLLYTKYKNDRGVMNATGICKGVFYHFLEGKCRRAVSLTFIYTAAKEAIDAFLLDKEC